MADDNRPSSVTALPMDDKVRAGLALLWQAYTHAHDAGVDVWDFALEIDKLYETGMTISDLRWLVAKRFSQHAQETSVYGNAHRSFHSSDGLNFTPTTRFVLTPDGIKFTAKALKESADTD